MRWSLTPTVTWSPTVTMVTHSHLVQLLDEEDEVLLVLLGAAPLARVLPVQVQTVEVVAPDEAEGGPGEGTPVLGAVLCCTVLYCVLYLCWGLPAIALYFSLPSFQPPMARVTCTRRVTQLA